MRLKFNMRNMTFCFAAVFIVACWGYQSQAQFGSTQTGGGFGIGNNGNPPEPPEPKKLDAAAAKNAPPVARLDKKIEAHEKIEKALQSKTACEFVKTPLEDVIKYFQKIHKINIQIDKNAFNEEGIDLDEPVEFAADKMSLESALNFILEPLEATYYVANESLVITSETKAEETYTTIVYDVRKLLLAGFAHSELQKAIESVGSGTWEDNGNGGEGTISPVPGCLVIKQTYHSHKVVFELLQLLEKMIDTTNAKTATIKPLVPKPLKTLVPIKK